MIEMSGITKAFSGNVVLNNVQFELADGEIHALMGENGAGKSTMMKILSGIYTKDAGEIKVDGQVVNFKSPKDAEKLGIIVIHQELNMLPDLTVAQNLFLGKELTYGKTGILKTRQMEKEASQLLSKLGLNVNPKNMNPDGCLLNRLRWAGRRSRGQDCCLFPIGLHCPDPCVRALCGHRSAPAGNALYL